MSWSLGGRRNCEELSAELKQINPRVGICLRGLDLNQSDQIAALPLWLKETGVSVDLLINNAGLGDMGSIRDERSGKNSADAEREYYRAHPTHALCCCRK